MKFLQAVIIALCLVLGVNSLPKAKSIGHLPRHVLEARLRTLLAPGLKAAIDDQIKQLLDTTVRDIILNGSPDLGFPVLDPLYLEHVDLDLNVADTVQLSGVLDQVTVSKLATFVIDNIKANLLLLRLDFGLSVPELTAEGNHYAIDGNLGGLLPVYGEGAFSASIQDASLSGTVVLGSNNSYLYIKSLALDVNVGDATVSISGIYFVSNLLLQF